MSTILAIEDSQPFVDLLRVIMPGQKIAHVPTLTAGFLLLRAQKFDVILLDLQLLDSDPEQTIALIPELKLAAAPARIVVVSGIDAYESDVRSMGVDFKSKCDLDYHRELPALLKRFLPFRPRIFAWVS